MFALFARYLTGTPSCLRARPACGPWSGPTRSVSEFRRPHIIQWQADRCGDATASMNHGRGAICRAHSVAASGIEHRMASSVRIAPRDRHRIADLRRTSWQVRKVARSGTRSASTPRNARADLRAHDPGWASQPNWRLPARPFPAICLPRRYLQPVLIMPRARQEVVMKRWDCMSIE